MHVQKAKRNRFCYDNRSLFENEKDQERGSRGDRTYGGSAAPQLPALVFFFFSQKSEQKITSLSPTSIHISSHCSSSCHSLLYPAPVRSGCLFCVLLSLFSPSSQQPTGLPVDCVSLNKALKPVKKPILLNRPSGLSD